MAESQFLGRRSNDVERACCLEHLLGANFQVLLIFDQEHVAFLVHPEEVEGTGPPPLPVLRPAARWFLLAHL